MPNYMELVICPDENYAMPCGVLMRSILYTNPGAAIRFHIISENLSTKSKDLLTGLLQGTKSLVSFYLIDPKALIGLPTLQNSFATYSRLFIADILPVEIHKALYFDTDTIVVNSLENLWSIDITGYPVAGTLTLEHGDIRTYNRLGYDPSMGYHNPGTLLMNLDYWRKNRLLEKCLAFAQNNPGQLKYHDQDILNVVLMGQWKVISLSFNCYQNCFWPIDSFIIRKGFHEEIRQARMNPVVIHFITLPKPWHKEYNMPLTKIWLFFMRMTPWKKTRLKYYAQGVELLKYKLKKILVILRICKPDLWDTDPEVNITAVIENIFNNMEKIRQKHSLLTE